MVYLYNPVVFINSIRAMLKLRTWAVSDTITQPGSFIDNCSIITLEVSMVHIRAMCLIFTIRTVISTITPFISCYTIIILVTSLNRLKHV